MLKKDISSKMSIVANSPISFVTSDVPSVVRSVEDLNSFGLLLSTKDGNRGLKSGLPARTT